MMDGVSYYYKETSQLTSYYTYTETTNDDGESVITQSRHTRPVTVIISEEEAYEHVNANDGVVVWAMYENGLAEQISELTEEVVGDTTTTTETETETTPTEISLSSSTMLATTAQTITISSVDGNTTFYTTVTPTKSGYTLVGVVGYYFTGTSQLSLYRATVDDGVVSIGCRNMSSNTISDKSITLTLLWALTGLVTTGS